MDVDHARVRVVMAENLAEIGTLDGHSFGSGLAKPNTMASPCSFHDRVITFFFHDEIVAGNHAPAEAACSSEAGWLVGAAKRCSLFGGDST